jgi:hypothetical protein
MKVIDTVKFGDVTGPEALFLRSNTDDDGRPLFFSGMVTQTLLSFLRAELWRGNIRETATVMAKVVDFSPTTN